MGLDYYEGNAKIFAQDITIIVFDGELYAAWRFPPNHSICTASHRFTYELVWP